MRYETTETLGARIKHARTERQLTQQQLADGIRSITQRYGSKASVSQYEADNVVPGHAVLVAIVALTGYAEQWLLTGTGPRKAELPRLRSAAHDGEARELLARAAEIAHEVHQLHRDRIGWATVAVFETLLDEPSTPRGALLRIARTAQRPA